MDIRMLENVTLNYFSWDDKNPTGGSEKIVSKENSKNGVLNLTDDEALTLIAFMKSELQAGKHISFRAFRD